MNQTHDDRNARHNEAMVAQTGDGKGKSTAAFCVAGPDADPQPPTIDF